jgi:hypothetical protein
MYESYDDAMIKTTLTRFITRGSMKITTMIKITYDIKGEFSQIEK